MFAENVGQFDRSLIGLAPGAQDELTVAWHITHTATGRYTVYAVADPEGVLVEADETNNWVGADAAILPDLVLRSTGVATGTTPSGDLLVSAWVFNDGMRDADGVILGLYDRLPGVNATPLVSTTLDIRAGEHRFVGLNARSYPWVGFYIGVGISGEIKDREKGNNLLLVGQVLPYRLYLPLVLRGG